MKRLGGILVATITPMGRNQAPDLEAVRELVEFFVEAGVHGVYVLASQGEFFSLDDQERRRVARAAVRASRGRVPVVANTGTVYTAGTIRLSREAEGEGVDALGLITPYYLRPTAQEMFQHYRAVLRSVRCPVYAYNNPARAGGVGLDATTVTRLAGESDRFAGIFDATGNLRYARRYTKLQGGRFGYFPAGQLGFPAAIRLGARGAVLATANAAPREFVQMYEASCRNDVADVERLRKLLEPLDSLFRTGPFPGTIKACLEVMGFRAGPPRQPALPVPPKIRAKAERVLRRLKAWRNSHR